MVVVEFLGPIDKDSMELDVRNLDELSKILAKDEDIAKWLPQCAVAVNDTMVSSRDIELKSGDRVSILPPVCGG